MSSIDKLVTEWAFRCKKGYPDMNNPDDMKILKEIYSEYGIVMEKEKPQNQTVDELTNEDVEALKSAFEKIKEPYSKYLSIFNYFDPNSLGTISEVLLTKLLNKVEGIEAEHVGGGQGLADIIVNGHHVSLKTTAKSKHIGLGSDQLNTTFADSIKIVEPLSKLHKEDSSLENLTINQLKERIPEDIYKTIYNRLDAIAKKLSGEHNKEFFVWVEKIYTGKLLTGLIIHTVKYNYSQVMSTFLNSKLVVTGKAWGIKDEKGRQLVRPDLSGKLLNITPEFVYSSSQDSRIPVDLAVSIKHSKEEIEKEVSNKFFTSLDTIYSELF
jgi:hypothetical protein